MRSGDTLSTIAEGMKVSGSASIAPAELLAQSNKPDVLNSNDIFAGQKLRIPVTSGVIHTVLRNETLSDVAAQYGVSQAAIRGVAGNALGSGELLSIGQELLVPGPARLPTPPPSDPTAAAAPPATEPAATATATASAPPPPPPEVTPTPGPQTPATGAATPPSTATASPAPRPPPAAARFIWPATGPISSYFGPSHPLGIDIDLFRTPNQPVVAAAGGIVTFAGGNACCSYGLYVVVDHGNGFTTLYAHLSSLAVSAGQRVAQGQRLGLGGRSGYATGNHLHFEVRRNGDVVNPLLYLP